MVEAAVSTELVRITNNVIGDKEVNSVDARELWKALESGQDFSTWMKAKVLENIFFEHGVDYILLNNIVKAQPGTPQPSSANKKDYALTTKAAKKVAMSEQTAVGNRVRDYFIECETQRDELIGKVKPKVKVESVPKPPTRLRVAKDLAANLMIAKFFGLEGNQALLSANTMTAKQYAEFGINPLVESGVPGLVSPTQIQYFTPTLLGKKIGVSAMKLNALLEAAGLQVKERGYKDKIEWNVTSLGKLHSQMLDTGKRHTNGTPIQQVKWAESALEFVKQAEIA